MKKILLIAAFCFTSLMSKAFVCSKAPYDGKTTNTCDCCAANNYNPTGCQGNVKAMCAAQAPINTGLIFLIIAGAGMGAFLVSKDHQRKQLAS